MSLPSTVLLKAFCGSSGSGSLQEMHFFDSVEQRDSAFDGYKVCKEFDVGFVTFAGEVALVRWKNKSGEIQICGSGAYALAWYALKELKFEAILIRGLYIEASAILKDGDPVLTLPAVPIVAVAENLYHDPKSGIYLEDLKTSESFESADSRLADFVLQSNPNVHGYCAFYWDNKIKQGRLRYFCPWHGRDEDSVTGSIHIYLGPLVLRLYGESHQLWSQGAENSGSLEATVECGFVVLKGRCTLV